MNTKKRLTNLLAVVALGAGISMFAPTADAAPRDGDVREARKEVKDERKDLKKAKREVRKADSPEERREARQDVRKERRDVKEARKDVKQERRENRRDNNWNNNSNNRYNNNNRYNSGSYNNRYNDNNSYNSGNYNYNQNQNNDYRTFTGRVTDVDSNGKFRLRAGNQDLDVYTRNGLPRGLDEGDTVRVYGVRYGDNDVRNANVSIINNR